MSFFFNYIYKYEKRKDELTQADFAKEQNECKQNTVRFAS